MPSLDGHAMPLISFRKYLRLNQIGFALQFKGGEAYTCVSAPPSPRLLSMIMTCAIAWLLRWAQQAHSQSRLSVLMSADRMLSRHQVALVGN